MSNWGSKKLDFNSYKSGNKITTQGTGQLPTVSLTNPQITNQKFTPGNVMAKNADGTWTVSVSGSTPKTALGGNVMKKNVDGSFDLVD